MSQASNFTIPEDVITLTEDEENDLLENNKSDEVISIKLNKYELDEKFIDMEINTNVVNNNEFELLNKKRKRENQKKMNFSLEFKLFYRIVEKYGIDKVLSSLFKSTDTFSTNALDQIIDKINDSYNINKFITSIIKTYYDLLEDYIINNPDIKKALLYKNNFDQQRIISNDNIKKEAMMFNFEFNVNNVIEIPINKEKSKNGENEGKNNILGLESHFNKNEDGNIYKYKIMYLLGGLAIFKCDDDTCNGDGIFDLDKKVFNIGQKHNKEYSEHKFVNNGILDNSIIFNEMNTNKYKDAQIIFEGNNKIVRFYC